VREQLPNYVRKKVRKTGKKKRLAKQNFFGPGGKFNQNINVKPSLQGSEASNT